MAQANFAEDLPPLWRARLAPQTALPYFQDLSRFLEVEYQAQQQIYPPRESVLRAFQDVDFDRVRVVILGQDPYHGDGQSIGRSFAVPNDLRLKPPSLQNIFKELKEDLQTDLPPGLSDLTGWAQQGVLMLNTVLTVRAHQAFSHRDHGWESFTDHAIRELNARKAPVVFVLWGLPAQKKRTLITNPDHFIIVAPHPSPLSAHRGFFGSRPFSKINEILVRQLGQRPIDWTRIST